jgi:gamma-glutamylaminecyclotransferase
MQENKKETILIAAYGTLMSGFGNNRLFRNSTLVGKGLTQELYTMRASGIPFVNKEPTSRIHVEVWEVPMQDLSFVDSLEGHPEWYKREEIPVELENKEVVNAWLYFNDSSSGVVVEDGNFRTYRSANSY